MNENNYPAVFCRLVIFLLSPPLPLEKGWLNYYAALGVG